MRTKFPKEHILVHKTTNLCATKNNKSCVILNEGGQKESRRLDHMKKANLKLVLTSLGDFERCTLQFKFIGMRKFPIAIFYHSGSDKRELWPKIFPDVANFGFTQPFKFIFHLFTKFHTEWVLIKKTSFLSNWKFEGGIQILDKMLEKCNALWIIFYFFNVATFFWWFFYHLLLQIHTSDI